MDLIKTVLTPLGVNSGSIQDTLKWVVIGGTVETARRVSKTAWNGFVDSFFLTAHFSQEDYPYDWLMHWLSKQPAWGQSREFEITTRTVGRSSLTQSTTGDVEDEEEEEDDNDEELVHGRRKRKVQFMPSQGTTHTIYYRGHWLRITRNSRTQGHWNYAELTVSVVARNNNILKKLVLEAKRDYEKDAEHRVHIFMADSYGSWRWNGARQKRPMSSIVLEPGVKDMLLADCRDFLRSEDWYAERGIPFRRGYLLHGVPGSGKTSLIHSLAGELGLDIYVVSLSSKGMSDNMLATLMGQVPSRCILLLEDLDAAFTRSVSRDDKANGTPSGSSSSSSSSSSEGSSSKRKNSEDNDGSTLSLSGLLNALDGVAAAEGRLLFATTNHIERLDPALSRPGRMDVWVNFKNATKWQAEGIFKCFFPSRAAREKADADKKAEKEAAKAKAAAASGSTATTTTTAAASEKKKAEGEDDGTKHVPGSKRKAAAQTHVVPVLEEEEINELAKKFAEQIPEDEMSVASLQGYLLKNKTRPRECVEEVAEWIVKERELRAKLKKEKEEKEAKELADKLAAEEKAKAEKAKTEAAKTETEKTDATATTTTTTATTTSSSSSKSKRRSSKEKAAAAASAAAVAAAVAAATATTTEVTSTAATTGSDAAVSSTESSTTSSTSVSSPTSTCPTSAVMSSDETDYSGAGEEADSEADNEGEGEQEVEGENLTMATEESEGENEAEDDEDAVDKLVDAATTATKATPEKWVNVNNNGSGKGLPTPMPTPAVEKTEEQQQ